MTQDLPETVERTPLARVARKLLRDRSVRSSFFAFALSRSIVLVFFLLGAHFTAHSPDGDVKESYLWLHPPTVFEKLRGAILTADVNWYATIAWQGYEKQPYVADRTRTWAFFPLFPMLLYAAALVTGEYALTGMALSNLFLLLALILLHKTAAAFGLEEADCDRSVFYIAVCPVSYFFSLPLTEALFLLVTVASFYAATRRSWYAAGALGALATATRTTGVALIPALFVLYFQQHRRIRPRADIMGLALVPLGLLAYMLYLYKITGYALAFYGSQLAWGRHLSFFWEPLLEYLSSPSILLAGWNFRTLNFVAAVTALVCGFVWLWRRQWTLAAYTLTAIFLSLSTGQLHSHARFVLVIFPVFMALALAGRRPLVDQTIRAVFLALLGLMAAFFAAHFSFVMA